MNKKIAKNWHLSLGITVLIGLFYLFVLAPADSLFQNQTVILFKNNHPPLWGLSDNFYLPIKISRFFDLPVIFFIILFLFIEVKKIKQLSHNTVLSLVIAVAIGFASGLLIDLVLDNGVMLNLLVLTFLGVFFGGLLVLGQESPKMNFLIGIHLALSTALVSSLILIFSFGFLIGLISGLIQGVAMLLSILFFISFRWLLNKI